jgi:hypothetical protein
MILADDDLFDLIEDALHEGSNVVVICFSVVHSALHHEVIRELTLARRG